MSPIASARSAVGAKTTATIRTARRRLLRATPLCKLVTAFEILFIAFLLPLRPRPTTLPEAGRDPRDRMEKHLPTADNLRFVTCPCAAPDTRNDRRVLGRRSSRSSNRLAQGPCGSCALCLLFRPSPVERPRACPPLER